MGTRRGAAKDRGVLEQYVEGLSGEPARLHAAAACRLVAAANPGYPLLFEDATGEQQKCS
ncbi:MAG: hypothetical protein IH803_06010 [Nitrospirae bacterium]|nr:hypothetical protein [Nitrospirota bacterium]